MVGRLGIILCVAGALLIADKVHGESPAAPAEAPSVHLKLQVTERWGPPQTIQMYHKTLRKWRTKVDYPTQNWGYDYACDGSTAWYAVWFGVEGAAREPREVRSRSLAHKWDIATLVNELGEGRTRSMLLDVAQAKVLFANPTAPPWNHELICREELSKGLERIGEERVGDAETVRYDKSGFRFWFGKEDGLLRKQVVLDSDGKERETLEVTHVELNPDIPDDTFRYQPPEGMTVRDETRGLIQWLTEQASGAERRPANAEASRAEEDESARGNWWIEAVIALVIGGLVGLGAAWLTARRLRRAPDTRKEKTTM